MNKSQDAFSCLPLIGVSFTPSLHLSQFLHDVYGRIELSPFFHICISHVILRPIIQRDRNHSVAAVWSRSFCGSALIIFFSFLYFTFLYFTLGINLLFIRVFLQINFVSLQRNVFEDNLIKNTDRNVFFVVLIKQPVFSINVYLIAGRYSSYIPALDTRRCQNAEHLKYPIIKDGTSQTPLHHLRYVFGDDPTTNSVSHKEAGIIVPHFEVSICAINIAEKGDDDHDALWTELGFYQPNLVVLQKINV